MVVALQPFSIQFTHFLSKNHEKHIKTTFYLNVTETYTLLEDENKNYYKKKRGSLSASSFLGDPLGVRTQDPHIKSVMLYRLS